MPTKYELQLQLKELQEEKDELSRANRQLLIQADRGFENSHLKAEMLMGIRRLENELEMAQRDLEKSEERYRQMQRRSKQNPPELPSGLPGDDNLSYYKARCEELEERCQRLEDRYELQTETMRNLRNIIDDLISGNKVAYPSPNPKKNAPGRPRTIDEKTRKRVRRLRREGYTMRQIAAAEDISLSSVNNIIHSVKK